VPILFVLAGTVSFGLELATAVSSECRGCDGDLNSVRYDFGSSFIDWLTLRQ